MNFFLVQKVVLFKNVYIHNPEFHHKRIDKEPKIESWLRNHFLEKGILHEGKIGNGLM